jgi:hypothetical protein
MCKLVYITAERALPLVNRSDKDSAIIVQELAGHERGIVKRFTKPYVYYIGAYEGCGCGFSYGQYSVEDEYDREQDHAARESVRQLAEYLSKAVRQVGDVEMFICWAGDEEEMPKYSSTMTPADFGGETFELKHPAFVLITQGGG